MFAAGTCSAGSSTSTTAPPRDRIRVSDPHALAQSPLTVNPTASSGLAVTLSSTTLPVCTVSGTTITLVTVGTCTIQADQAGDAIYKAAASVTRSFTISKATQMITFANPGPKTMIQSPLTVSATTSSGLVVMFTTSTPSVCTAGGLNGATITLVGPGTCTVKADQPGNAVYKPAPTVSRNFKVS
jgi:hypothetical protein